MRKAMLFTVFATAFVCAAVVNVPLSFAMKRSGIIQQGIGWQQARGTIWHGQVTGLVVRGDAAGAVEGDFSLVRLLQGKPGHLIHWTGPFGRGSAFAAVTPDHVTIRQGRAIVTFDATRISSAFPAQDVSLRLSDVSLVLDRAGCRTASGDVSTDALASISATYGAAWPELTGFLTCEKSELAISVKGRAADGTQIAARANLQGGGRLELWDVPESQTTALLLAGFTNNEGRFVYMQTSPNGETSQ